MSRSALVSRSAVVSSLLTAAVLLAGCGGAGPGEVVPAADDRPLTSAPAGTAPATGESAVEEVPVAEPAADEPAAEEPVAEGPPVEELPVEEPPVEEAPAEEPTEAVWPDEVLPVHGSRVWAVYLAVGSPDSQWDLHMLGETESYAGFLGYTGSGVGSVSCDQGAAEALGFDPGDSRVAVYFDSAARAQEFVAVYDRQDVGSAQVTTYCLD